MGLKELFDGFARSQLFQDPFDRVEWDESLYDAAPLV